MKLIIGSEVKILEGPNIGRYGIISDSTDNDSIVDFDNGLRLSYSNHELEYVPCEPITIDDPVNHPKHYTFGKFEVIDVLMDWFKDRPLLWQVGKYIARAYHKGNTLEDLKKARWYLDKQIELENQK